jgi:hypothetical protein
MVCSDFWGGLVEWIKEELLKKHGNVSKDDLFFFKVLDDPDEVVHHIKRTVIL